MMIDSQASWSAEMDSSNLEKQILGTLYGNCIGDAIGLLAEFMTKSEAHKVSYYTGVWYIFNTVLLKCRKLL